MKPTLAFLLYFYILAALNGQSIQGRVVDSNTLEPLEFVSMGVINTRIGTITNKKGEFSLEVNDLSSDSTLRISMIGYNSQTFSVGELPDEGMTIRLVVKPVQIAEVTVKPFGEAVKIGTTSFSRIGNWCGWGDKRPYAWAYSSKHTGGAQFLLADGSTHFISENIDQNTWAYLGYISDGEPLGDW